MRSSEQIPYGVKDFKRIRLEDFDYVDIFMTGVSPVTMDDLTSGFNIATNISQEPDFHAMVGFTADETRRLFEDFQGVGRFTGDVASHLDTVERWYDGYCFASRAPSATASTARRASTATSARIFR